MSAGLALTLRVNSCWSTMPSPWCTSIGLADQVDGDLGGDDLVAPDDEEVDVGDHVLDRVVLDVTGQGQEVGAVDLSESRVLRPASPDMAIWNSRAATDDRDRVGAVAVDHPGDPPCRGGGGSSSIRSRGRLRR